MGSEMCIRDRVIATLDKMAEWLRRWTVNPLGFPRAGSNPIFAVFFYGEMNSNLEFEFSNPSSNLGKDRYH